jgi:hypothetical protein
MGNSPLLCPYKIMRDSPITTPTTTAPQAATGKALRLLLLVALAGFVVFSLITNRSLPMFEGFDEISHYRVIDHYAREWRLPDLTAPVSHEAHQPPLYYVAGALLVAGIDRSDLWDVFQVDPQAGLNRRQNAAPTDMSLLPQGTTLAVRVLRLFSTLLGLGTLILTYRLSLLLWPRRAVAVAALWLLAFNPKFIYLSSIISNDIAAAFAASIALVFTAWLMQRGKLPAPWHALLLGALVGITTLCKLSGLAMLAPAAFGLLFVHWQGRREDASRWPARLLGQWVLLGMGFALVAGGFFVHQFVRYGHPLAWQQVNALNIFAQRAEPLNFIRLLQSYALVLPTFWRFSADGPLQNVIDLVLSLLCIAAFAGFVSALLKRRVPPAMTLLPVVLLASAVALIPWMRSYGGTEDARLLSPAFGSMAIACVAGVVAWLNEKVRRIAGTVAFAASAMGATLAPALVIAPTFPPLPPLPANAIVRQVSPDELAQLPYFTPAHFANGMTLIGATMTNTHARAGETLPVTLYWRVDRAVMQPYALSLEVIDDSGASLGRRLTTPLNGRRSTQLWQVGDVYRDPQDVTLTSDMSHARLATLFAGLQSVGDDSRPVPLENASSLSAPAGRVKVSPAQATEQQPQSALQADFGDAISLEGYTLDAAGVMLFWRALQPPAKDFNVFVHVLDASGTIIAQADGPPQLPSSWWDANEQVIDLRALAALDQAQSIEVGWYDLATQQRLPARKPDGTLWPNDAVVLWQRPAP